ncbi:MAG: hypothetical protein JWM86_2004 [Thermoleophilia bacterium]|nr:hypothetical protein [Thermoleophilia bacterium]
MLSSSRTPRTGERGVAILATLALLVLASFVIIGIIVAAGSTKDASRDKLDSSAATQLARDAGAALGASYSAMTSGEFDGFSPSEAVLRGHARRIGGQVVANRQLPAELRTVDPRVPASSQFAVSQSLQDGRTGWWQVFSVKLPDWGRTPGGRVVVYVRTWTTGAAGTATQPTLYRIDFRPRYFADYQLLFDGPMIVGSGAVISGPVHSNGQQNSFLDQFRPQVNRGEMITFEPGSSCASTAKISLAVGRVVGNARCAAMTRRSDERYNLLRARDAAARMRVICDGPHPSLDMLCLDTTGTTLVRLRGSFMYVNGRRLDAGIRGDRPGDNQGAVLVAAGRVDVSGALSPGARALVVTSSDPGSGSYGVGGAPSAWITDRGDVGAAPGDVRSSFGLVAEGDVIFDELQSCGVTFRGAMLTMTGLARSNPTWSQYAAVSGGRTCNAMTIRGSVSSHYAPSLLDPYNNAGFRRRNYAWLPALYDNPPPLYPTASDWETTALEPANLDCFTGANLDVARAGCT